MIRFRNPGTQYNTQIQVFKELYADYKDVSYFTLDDMAKTITRVNLMTAYGYGGREALAISNKEKDSLNSTKMNAKMYAEVFRLLGWIAAKEKYFLIFTYIGEHIALTPTEYILPLYEQCVLGINNPQEIMNVKYNENIRFFKTVLFSLNDLDRIMYKHELCIGPMSINDTNEQEYDEMIEYIKNLRGKYENYERTYQKLCKELNVKLSLPDNSTRLPIAFMKTCNWIETIYTKELYPPKNLLCIYLTEHGKEVLEEIKNLKDLRLPEYYRYSEKIQKSLIRLGIYSMLSRAGYDINPVSNIINEDKLICSNILKGKELLFSPYQTIHYSIVDEALGIIRRENISISNEVILPNINKKIANINNLSLNIKEDSYYLDKEIEIFKKQVSQLKLKGKTINEIIEEIFLEHKNDTQISFYPFVAMLFRVINFNCFISRAGDNGSRWDAIITDVKESIPIEIKSPTEEIHISLKAIRQALENKIILLSRKTHITLPETTSLVVGYSLPNDRAEVLDLIENFKITYNYNIGVIDLKTLLKISINFLNDNKIFNKKDFNRVGGFINVDI